MKMLLVSLGVLLGGCATSLPPPITFDYVFCKSGIGGDWRVGTTKDTDGEEKVVLFLFSVGGPYDKEHVLCAVSGDHAILDLGKGQQS